MNSVDLGVGTSQIQAAYGTVTPIKCTGFHKYGDEPLGSIHTRECFD